MTSLTAVATGLIGREFFARSTAAVAADLIGATLQWTTVEGTCAGEIVETEAYFGETDLASHAARRQSGNVRAMWGLPGIVYVYRCYGIHMMLNIVTEQPGVAGAVLIRAIRPTRGIELMRRRRSVEDIRALCSGPGKLCQALAIDLADHGRDIVRDPQIAILPRHRLPSLVVGERIGITRSRDLEARFFASDSDFRSAHARGRRVLDVQTAPSFSQDAH